MYFLCMVKADHACSLESGEEGRPIGRLCLYAPGWPARCSRRDSDRTTQGTEFEASAKQREGTKDTTKQRQEYKGYSFLKGK